MREARIDHELAKIVLPILEVQPEFKDKAPMINTMKGSVGFQSLFVAPRLVREARRRKSAKAAVTWLAKVLGTDSGPDPPGQGCLARANNIPVQGFSYSAHKALERGHASDLLERQR